MAAGSSPSSRLSRLIRPFRSKSSKTTAQKAPPVTTEGLSGGAPLTVAAHPNNAAHHESSQPKRVDVVNHGSSYDGGASLTADHSKVNPGGLRQSEHDPKKETEHAGGGGANIPLSSASAPHVITVSNEEPGTLKIKHDEKNAGSNSYRTKTALHAQALHNQADKEQAAYASEEKNISSLDNSLKKEEKEGKIFGPTSVESTELEIKTATATATHDKEVAKLDEQSATMAEDHLKAYNEGAAYDGEEKNISSLDNSLKKEEKEGKIFGPTSVESTELEIKTAAAQADKDLKSQALYNQQASAIEASPYRVAPASPGSNQPGLGMAPGTTLASYPGAHTDSTSGALVDGEIAGKDLSVQQVVKDSGETWSEFHADNTEFKEDGTIDKGRGFEIRADKAQEFEANLKASAPAPQEGLGSQISSVAPAPAPKEGLGSQHSVVNQPSGQVSGLGPTQSVAPATYPGAHTDSTSGALVESEVAPRSISVEDVVKDSGETWSEFHADNTEFKEDGTIDKGRGFEIRADKAQEFEANLNAASPAPSAPAPIHPPTTEPISSVPTPPPPHPTGGAPVIPVSSPTSPAHPPTADPIPAPAAPGVAPASPGSTQPGLGMAPGTTLASYPGAHIDSTSGALVQAETAASNVSVQGVVNASGETWSEFHADNTEFKEDGTIDKGRGFEIRADKASAFPNNSTYDVVPPSAGSAAPTSSISGGVAPADDPGLHVGVAEPDRPKISATKRR